ncbi:MAG: hypothetical protein Q7N95_12655 [Alphaproteobacteria bacterium]|nr:hypothetical protein [Alphaproteobacteria bacterium]
MNNHRELSIDELGRVSGGGFNIGRPFLPQILSKPASDPKPTGSCLPTTSTAPKSHSMDPVKVTFG